MKYYAISTEISILLKPSVQTSQITASVQGTVLILHIGRSHFLHLFTVSLTMVCSKSAKTSTRADHCPLNLSPTAVIKKLRHLSFLLVIDNMLCGCLRRPMGLVCSMLLNRAW